MQLLGLVFCSMPVLKGVAVEGFGESGCEVLKYGWGVGVSGWTYLQVHGT